MLDKFPSSATKGTNYAAPHYLVSSSLLLPSLESPGVLFLNALEDKLKGGGLIFELYTCVFIVISISSHHTHVY